MTFRPSMAAVGAALMALTFGSGAHAAHTIFQGVDATANAVVPPGGNALTQYAAFLAATTGEVVETFESAPVGPLPDGGLSIFGGTGLLAPVAGAGGSIENTTSPSGPGRFNTSPLPCPTDLCNWFETYQSFVVSLGANVSAFGFFDTDLGDKGAVLSLDFLNGDMVVASATVPASGERGVGFFGYVNPTLTFNRVAFNLAQSTTDPDLVDYVGFDGLVRATLGDDPVRPTPVPATLALALAGLGLLAATRRRSAAR